jgi:hypothetical protein
MTEHTHSPRDNVDELVDFGLWHSHFDKESTGSPDKTDDCNCHHPSNMQSRQLTTKKDSAHGVRGILSLYTNEPNFEATNMTYWKMDWVALTEFYHKSKCVR